MGRERVRARGRARFLSHCGLTELPAGMGALRALTKLWLTHNALRALPPDFGDLPGLEWLWLNDNLFATVRPPGAAPPPRMRAGCTACAS